MASYLKSFVAAGAVMMFAGLATPAQAHVYWFASFETGDFSEWSYAQGADITQGGPGPQYCYITNQNQSGIVPQNGNYFAHFQRPASAVSLPHAKLFKEWSDVGKLDQWRRKEDNFFDGPKVDGTYIAWYYFPLNYTASKDWVNIFQFKENGFDKNGVAMQNPSWWLDVGPQSSFANGNVAMENNRPVLFVNNWGNSYVNFHPKTVPLILGRWVEVRVHLYQGDRIEWYVNGKLLDTTYNSTYPVGRFYPKSTGFVFGVGHYGGIGEVYIDHCYVMNNP